MHLESLVMLIVSALVVFYLFYALVASGKVLMVTHGSLQGVVLGMVMVTWILLARRKSTRRRTVVNSAASGTQGERSSDDR